MNSGSVLAGKSLRTRQELDVLDHHRDRREIGDRVVERLLVEHLAEGVRALVAEQEHRAVGRRLGDARGAVHAAGAADILDDHLLAEPLGQLLRHQAADEIDRAAGRERHHHGDRPRRPVLRDGGTAEHERDQGREQDLRHGVSPCNSLGLMLSAEVLRAWRLRGDAPSG